MLSGKTLMPSKLEVLAKAIELQYRKFTAYDSQVLNLTPS
jgi:hypothetical protein